MRIIEPLTGMRLLADEHYENLVVQFKEEIISTAKISPHIAVHHLHWYGITKEKSIWYHYFCYKKMRKPVFDKVKEFEKPGSKILDVGCSWGYWTKQMSIIAPDSNIVAIEKAKAAVEVAESVYNNRNMTYKVGDAHNLEFEDDSFDIVYSCNVLEHVKNSKRVIFECLRVLKPGGVFVCTTPTYDFYDFWQFPDTQFRKMTLGQMLTAPIGALRSFVASRHHAVPRDCLFDFAGLKTRAILLHDIHISIR